MEEGANFGSYQLIKRIAFGGMAEIHLAKATGIGGFEKLLALKVIHPKFSADQEFIDMLVDEAKIAVQLSHVNVAQIFDLGRIEETYYIAMEFIDGKDLYQLLVKCSELDLRIPFDIIVFIAMEAAAGLHYAHTKSDNYGRALDLIHRDISPQNVLISYDGEIKIVDFGIAKASQRSKETESGVIKGKFFYMSPEQAWGDPIDARTDIFSTGICLYEMITGEMLYNEDKALALLDKVRKAEIPPMRQRRPDLPPALEQIVLKALVRDRDRRYQTAGELQRSLSQFLYSTWPDFNRNRVKAFMRQVFGDQRFVLPLPAPKAAAQPAKSGSLMGAGDFDLNDGHSVIFELKNLPASAQVGSGRAARPAPAPARPAPAPVRPGRPAPPAEVALGAEHFADDDEDDADERTIAEMAWEGKAGGPKATVALPPPRGGRDDDEDETAVIDMDAVEAARAMANPVRPAPAAPAPAPPPPAPAPPAPAPPARGKGRDDDDPATALFMRGDQAPPARAHRPVVPQAGPTAPVPPPIQHAPPPDPAQVERAVGPAAALPAGPPPGMPPMPPGPLPPAPKPLRPPPTVPPPRAAGPAPAAPATARPTPTRPPPGSARTTPARDSDPAEASAAAPAKGSKAPPAKAPPAKAEEKPRKPKASEREKPTLHVNPPKRRKGLGKLFSPAGITLMALLAIGTAAAFLVVPLFNEKPAATTMSLVVTSVPPGAAVVLDDQAQSQPTPTRVDGLVIGTQHRLQVSLKGYEPHEETFTVNADPSNEIKRRIFLKKGMGKIELTSVPPGAEIYVDGKYIGDTPLTKEKVDRERNEVLLLVRKDGYEDQREVLTWGEETVLKHETKLKPRGKK